MDSVYKQANELRNHYKGLIEQEVIKAIAAFCQGTIVEDMASNFQVRAYTGGPNSTLFYVSVEVIWKYRFRNKQKAYSSIWLSYIADIDKMADSIAFKISEEYRIKFHELNDVNGKVYRLYP